MAVSANTLFHFTSIKGLKGILSSRGFYCQYSDEHFENILPSRSKYRFTYIPMISFCDLTIMQLTNDSVHRKDFGEFGIGLTKEWGIRNGVSPVMYVHKESQQTKRVYRLIKAVKGFRKRTKDDESMDKIRQEMIDSFKYIKPYSGNWQRGKKIKEKIVFYNEREWRYSPLLEERAVFSAVTKRNKKKIKELNTELKTKIINFEVKDVKFIVIKSKRDIQVIAKTINEMAEISDAQKNELITKIISFEEIREDFG